MVTLLFGTRPERRKLLALALELTRRRVRWQAICSDQHTTLLDGLAEDPAFPVLHRLGAFAHGDPLAYRDALVPRLTDALRATHATLVLVQGDTATASAGGLAAHALGLPLVHLEAGLRTHDLQCPWPEEGFRVGLARLADWHYAPTEGNAAHLRDEGVPADRILVTGNPGLDPLVPLRDARPVPFVPQPRLLVTLHRRESHGAPLQRILDGLCAALQQRPGIDALWPVHPNPAVQQSLADRPLPPNLHLLPPLSPDTFSRLLAASRAVLTDSGGVQEEAAFLGVPAVIARDKTDRPESVSAGLARLAGTQTDAVRVHLLSALGFDLPATPSAVFGDGHSAPRIVDHLLTIV